MNSARGGRFFANGSPDRARSERLDADDFIVKPQNLTEFVSGIGAAVRMLLEKAETRCLPPAKRGSASA